MTTKIDKQNFYIASAKISLALSELRTAYPEIELTNEEDVSNLQLLLFHLGFHTRVQVDSSVFTISRLPHKVKYAPIKILTCLTNYMEVDGYIIAEIDGEKIEFRKDNITRDECPSNNTESIEQIENIQAPEETIELEQEPLITEDMVDTSESTPIKTESVIDSTVVKKRKGGRPRKSTST